MLLRSAKCVGFIPQDAFCGAFDAFAQSFDLFASDLFLLSRVFPETSLPHHPRAIEILLGIVHFRVAVGIVEFLGEQGFDLFGFFHGVADLLDKLIHSQSLVVQAFAEILVRVLAAKRRRFITDWLAVLHLLGDVPLSAFDFLDLLTHLSHLFGKLIGGPILKFIA